MRRFSSAVFAFLTVSALAGVPVDAAKVADVKAGKLAEARVEWWGWNGADDTAAIQAALDSGARKVVFGKMSGPWVSLPLFGRSDTELVFEEGAELQAKRGAYRGKRDSLLTFRAATNIAIRGLGAKGGALRMHKADYQKPPYEPAEWRYALQLSSVKGAHIENMSFLSSGGDGIVLGRSRFHPDADPWCENVIIRRCVCDDNHRQGISVCSGKNVLIEDTVLSNTRGTAPQSGIDFEPDQAHESISNCVMRNCISKDNAGCGFEFYLGQLSDKSMAVDVLIENCRSVGNLHSVLLSSRRTDKSKVNGVMCFRNCAFVDARASAIHAYSKDAETFRVEFDRCTVSNACTEIGSADVTYAADNWRESPPDGFLFRDCTVFQHKTTDWFAYSNPTLAPESVNAFSGRVTVVASNGLTKAVALDDAWRARTFPPRGTQPIPPSCPILSGDAARAVLHDAAPGETVELAKVECLRRVAYLFYAPEAMTVRLALRQIVGKGGAPLQGELLVTTPGGTRIAAVPYPGTSTEEIAVKVPERGFYRLYTFDPRLRMTLERATVPVALDFRDRAAHLRLLDGTQSATLWCDVPDARAFMVAAFAGEGRELAWCLRKDDAELRREQFGSGWTAYGAKDVPGLCRIDVARLPDKEAGLFRLETVGVPAVLFLSGQKTWTLPDSEWISVREAPVFEGAVKDGLRAADGTSWFVRKLVNEGEVKSVRWTTAGLGVYEVSVNGRRVGDDFLKPGFTHNGKTKYSFAYDVTELVKTAEGAENVFTAEVSAGWWRDKICSPSNRGGGFFGRKSAFRSVIEVTYADGTVRRHGTDTTNWKAGVAGPVLHAAIFDGEEYDARRRPTAADFDVFGAPERNEEFKGELLPTAGAEVCLRRDREMKPVEAYVWRDVKGAAGTNAYGTVVKARTYAAGEPMRIEPGETLVVDFGQNAAAVPDFRFKAARGTVLTALPAEMLNDGNGARARGNDGPEGSVYRVNLRAGYENGRLVRYTFAGDGVESYLPRFTFFGYRYLSVTATAPVEIADLRSVPVSSIRPEMELGKLEVGDPALNRFVANVYWGQLSNYLSVPTDCPQRNERLGWAADTQVFAEAAGYNADVRAFLRKWMRDERDSQHANGGFPSVAPFAQYGNESMRVGWADAGVIVPYVVWRQFGDRRIVDENWEAMTRFLAYVERTKYAFAAIREDCRNGQYADWLSFEDYEPASGRAYRKGSDGSRQPRPEAVRYWDYLGGCYWLTDARMMAEMAAATGRAADVERWRASSAEARRYLRENFIDPSDGLLIAPFRPLQGAALFALRCGILATPAAVEATKTDYCKSLAAAEGCNQTGFLGTSVLMDTLTEHGMTDVAYDLLLNHKFPSWLYSVDQGATTVWERWNSYTKERGFGPVGMNSFNHYAYGAVLAWLYRTAAGIAADPKAPGFRNILMAPKPDHRLGHLTAEYRSAAGLVKSAWHYEGKDWVWTFTIPAGATADVTLPCATIPKRYGAGTYTVRMPFPGRDRPMLSGGL